MRSVFKSSTAGLALTLAGACVNPVNGDGRSATSNVSASVTAPVTIDTFQIISTSTFVSGTTGDLIIRLPGAGPSGMDDEDGASLSSETSLAVAVVAERCRNATGSLADCIMSSTDDGMLEGDPVSDVGIEAFESDPSGTTDVSVTVLYN